MAIRELAVWMNGEHVGIWSWSRTGTHIFRYDNAWLASPNVRALSLSLPIPAGKKELRGPKVKSFFDNLLPDSDRIRERIRTRYQLGSAETQELLSAIGRDCVGAVQLLPPDTLPEGFDRIEGTPLGDADVERLLMRITSDAVLGQEVEGFEDFRISIAGAQEKTALLKLNGQWHRPHGATPTTHILKLPLGLVGNMRADMSNSVENEWLCSRIMHAFGFAVANTEMASFGKQKTLVVERFDRRRVRNNTWIARLPQEDFCQATGTPAQSKYESQGGPGMRKCLELLAASEDATTHKRAFVLAQLAFWLLAATDGHAKNFSVFLLPGDGYAMTPLYDILSAWPIVGKGPNLLQMQKIKLAMAVRTNNAHYKLVDIQTRHWHALAEQSGVVGVFDAMQEIVQNVDQVLARVEIELPADFPEQVWTSIRDGILAQKRRFLEGLVALG